MEDWNTAWITDWLAERLTKSEMPTHRLTYTLLTNTTTEPAIDWFTNGWLTDPLTEWQSDCLDGSLTTYWLTDGSIYRIINPQTSLFAIKSVTGSKRIKTSPHLSISGALNAMPNRDMLKNNSKLSLTSPRDWPGLGEAKVKSALIQFYCFKKC